ncbi:MAG: lipopolysaccharide biosynthesis protein [Gemmatimonadota bacterium]|nr:lipopolysaccharide biosynthesis protein [Gemmatimonadota bacterium]
MSETSAGSRAIGGTLRIFLAEALILPTGLVTAGFLTRRLGAADYGMLALATTVVTWLEWCISSLFARATFKLVAEAEDWRPAGSTVVWLSGVTGMLVALLLCLLAAPLSELLHQPGLVAYLRLFSLDIPFFALAQAHRNILVGIGEYRHRAIATAWRWLSRMALIMLLVGAGLSVTGAILGSIGASLVELGASRYYVRPPVRRPPYAMRALWDYAVPLFAAGVAARLLDKLDLFMLSALGGGSVQAGQYGAAQNLSVVPGLFALSLSSLLLSALSRSLGERDMTSAQDLARNALRVSLLLLPYGAMTAGASVAIVSAIFGSSFAPAGPALALLIFAALAVLIISVASAILIAAGRPRWVARIALPLPALALAADLVAIPRWGMRGAAGVTLLAALCGAAAALGSVHVLWRVHPSAASLARSVAVSIGVYLVAQWWGASGPLLALELLAIGAAIPAAYLVLGELDERERNVVFSALRQDAHRTTLRSEP